MTLDKIATEQDKEPIELPRLTVRDTFTSYQNLGYHLETALTTCNQIPKAGVTTTDKLKEIVRACEGAIKCANRMLEANK